MRFTGIRTVAVGLGLGGYLMTPGQSVVENLQTIGPLSALDLGLILPPESATALGSNMTTLMSWTALCLGAGLFAAGVVWPLIESTFYGVIDELASGISHGLKSLKQRYDLSRAIQHAEVANDRQ